MRTTKKAFLTIIAILLLVGPCFATGASTTATSAWVINQRNVAQSEGMVPRPAIKEIKAVLVTITITADNPTGAVTSLTISSSTNSAIYYRIQGMKLAKVTAYKTAGGTAPDAADVTVKQNLLDLLGGNGVDLIHASATQSTYAMTDAYPDKPRIYGALVVAVANQITSAATITIELLFED